MMELSKKYISLKSLAKYIKNKTPQFIVWPAAANVTTEYKQE